MNVCAGVQQLYRCTMGRVQRYMGTGLGQQYRCTGEASVQGFRCSTGLLLYRYSPVFQGCRSSTVIQMVQWSRSTAVVQGYEGT
jgi:hypothetical protein